MKTCGDHAAFFEREIEVLGGKPFDLAFRRIFELLSKDTSAEADEACRVFASTFQWPQVDDCVRFELCMRLDCARCYCVNGSNITADDEAGDEFLCGLLIEYWNDVGKRDWLYENYCLNDEERASYYRRTFGRDAAS